MIKLLEVGVDGIVYTPSSIEDIEVLNRLRSDITNLDLVDAELIDITL